MNNTFLLKNANSVGHLISGNVQTFLDQTLSSNKMLYPNINFIENFIFDFHKNSINRDNYINSESLLSSWERIKMELIEGEIMTEHLKFFKTISEILIRCKIKVLTIPGFTNTEVDKIMKSRELLRKLIDIPFNDSAIILQVEETSLNDNLSVLNVFPQFEMAFNEIDNWPGILIWNQIDSIFLKIDYPEQFTDIFTTLKFENDSIKYLRSKFQSYSSSKYAYFFHLSDLHFGNMHSNNRKSRLTTILKKHKELLGNPISIPIITGDLVDDPKPENELKYFDFCDHLKDLDFQEPIQILGNHDISKKGILRIFNRQKSLIASLSSKSIEILPDLRVAFVRFNSNTSGQLAQGKVGSDQFMTIGNNLDSLKDPFNCLIALIHHHPLPIETPKWHRREKIEEAVTEKFIEKSLELIDADIFLDWLYNRKIKLVLHGHKHIPHIQKHKNITIVGAGSSTGRVRHSNGFFNVCSY